MGRDTSGKPHVAPHDAIMADDRFSTQNRGSRINDYIVFNGGMALHLSILLIHTESSECDSLVDLYIVANGRCLANHNTRTVVDAELAADRCSRVDINTGEAMRMLCNNSRHTFNAKLV